MTGASVKILTVRVEDDLHEDLVRDARAQGTSVSEVARARISRSDDRSDPNSTPGRTRYPDDLTTVERQTLSLLHRVLAEVSRAESYDLYSREGETRLATILEQGYVTEYDSVFERVEDAVSRSDAALVMDILDMFQFLKLSWDDLSPADRAVVGLDRASHLEFAGFNNRNDVEARLLRFAQHLIDDSKWDDLAVYFDREHDHGISGFPTLPLYRRMMDVYEPIWRKKLRVGTSAPVAERYRLTADELAAVARAAIHPDHR
jgi:uncharacterized protein YfbU (UPF0304 family)